MLLYTEWERQHEQLRDSESDEQAVVNHSAALLALAIKKKSDGTEERRWPRWMPSPRGRWTEWRARTLWGCGTGARSFWAGSPHSTIGDTRWCWVYCARMADAPRGWTRRTQ